MQRNQMRTCPRCKAVNASDSRVCRWCGAVLEENGDNATVPEYTCFPEDIQENALFAFVGPKAQKYLNKWKRLQARSGHAGCNGAVVALGLLGNPIFYAAWFLYRGIKKIGGWLLPVAVVFLGLQVFLLSTLFSGMSVLTDAAIDTYVQTYAVQPDENGYVYIQTEQFAEILEQTMQSPQYAELTAQIGYCVVGFGVLWLVNFCLAGVFALFADHLYYRFAVRSIRSLRRRPDFCDADICYFGGVHTAYCVVPCILYLFFCSLALWIM